MTAKSSSKCFQQFTEAQPPTPHEYFANSFSCKKLFDIFVKKFFDNSPAAHANRLKNIEIFSSHLMAIIKNIISFVPQSVRASSNPGNGHRAHMPPETNSSIVITGGH
jgi:hypothetical protein